MIRPHNQSPLVRCDSEVGPGKSTLRLSGMSDALCRGTLSPEELCRGNPKGTDESSSDEEDVFGSAAADCQVAGERNSSQKGTKKKCPLYLL